MRTWRNPHLYIEVVKRSTPRSGEDNTDQTNIINCQDKKLVQWGLIDEVSL